MKLLKFELNICDPTGQISYTTPNFSCALTANREDGSSRLVSSSGWRNQLLMCNTEKLLVVEIVKYMVRDWNRR